MKGFKRSFELTELTTCDPNPGNCHFCYHNLVKSSMDPSCTLLFFSPLSPHFLLFAPFTIGALFPFVLFSISLSAGPFHQYKTVSHRSDNWQLSMHCRGLPLSIEASTPKMLSAANTNTHTDSHTYPQSDLHMFRDTIFHLHPHHTSSSLT